MKFATVIGTICSFCV